jgi:hypothetical protein
MIETFTAESMSSYVGDVFRVVVDEDLAFDTELIHVTPGQGVEGGRVPFSLVFRGPADLVVPQRTYRMEHPGLGAFEIFIVPIGPDEDGMGYEAVFT